VGFIVIITLYLFYDERKAAYRSRTADKNYHDKNQKIENATKNNVSS